MKATLVQAGLMAALLASAGGISRAALTNSVTGGNGADYTVNSQNDPALTLVRGVTYVFQLSSLPSHPFNIRTAINGSQFNTGVTGNGSTSGAIIFAVPTNAPATLAYQCGNHSAMAGVLNIIDPPTPPPFRIVSLALSSNLTMRYTGTNAFTYTPEGNTNLATTNWFVLTVQTNTFAANGTNEVICGLPPGTNVFLRIRAQ